MRPAALMKGSRARRKARLGHASVPLRGIRTSAIRFALREVACGAQRKTAPRKNGVDRLVSAIAAKPAGVAPTMARSPLTPLYGRPPQAIPPTAAQVRLPAARTPPVRAATR